MGAGGKLAGNLLTTGKFLGNQTPNPLAPLVNDEGLSAPTSDEGLSAPTSDASMAPDTGNFKGRPSLASATSPSSSLAKAFGAQPETEAFDGYSNGYNNALSAGNSVPSADVSASSYGPSSQNATPFKLGMERAPEARTSLMGGPSSGYSDSGSFGNSSTDLSRRLIGDLNPMKSSPAGGGFWSDLGQAVKKPEVIGGFLKGMSGMRQSDAEAKYANARTASLEQQTRLQKEQYEAQQARAKALQPLLDAMMGKMSGAMGQQTSVAPNPYAR
jgi:hypothetical protein